VALWDPIFLDRDIAKFHDYLKHSYFQKNTYMWDPSEFYDDLEHYLKIILTCETNVGL
jgi:hypothetical protein